MLSINIELQISQSSCESLFAHKEIDPRTAWCSFKQWRMYISREIRFKYIVVTVWKFSTDLVSYRINRIQLKKNSQFMLKFTIYISNTEHAHIKHSWRECTIAELLYIKFVVQRAFLDYSITCKDMHSVMDNAHRKPAGSAYLVIRVRIGIRCKTVLKIVTFKCMYRISL